MLLITNARIYTLDPENPLCSALLIDEGRIKALGTKAGDLDPFRGKADHFDAAGGTILPGLIDAHLHLEHYALGLIKVDCETATKTECIKRVSERSSSSPAGEWILGHGWNQNSWEDGFGDAADLDQFAPERPVYLTAKSLHAAWANSYALRLANITSTTPDPPGGRIGRDADGAPNGILLESAMELVAGKIPAPSTEQVAEAIRSAQESLWRVGLTGVHDFDRSRCFSALQMLHERDELQIRVLKSIPLEDMPHAIAIGLRSGFGDDMLRIGSVKAFADGALGPRTAAMIQPFEGEPDNRGMLLLDKEQLAEYGRMATEHGLSLAVHAIGDRANHEVLDAFEQIRNYEHKHGKASLRHRIEHVQLIHPMDADRLARLSIIASMQPVHATSDMLMADRYWGERAIYSYAWRTQLEMGATLAFGSDAPVESPNPFWGLHAAVTRQRPDGKPGAAGWFPEQKLAFHDALQGFTVGASFAAGTEKKTGKLSPGYLADLILCDIDPYHCEAHQLRDITPRTTMVAGKWVYRSG